MALLIRRALAAVAVAAAALVLVRADAAGAQETVEQEVKAAFLYNFTKFVEWPSPGTSEPFRVCVAADRRFARLVDQIIQGETVHGRPLVRVDVTTPEAVRDCHMLYVGRGETDRAVRLVAAARHAPVLTVGEGPRFLREGGAIQFVVENNRVRFDINLPAAERAGLRVSSKLLRVARTVHPGGGR